MQPCSLRKSKMENLGMSCYRILIEPPTVSQLLILHSIPLETKASVVPATASKPTFSFAETMANLNKPKEPTSVKAEDVRPPETDEERAKRLRKESRRSLRVSFKPDDSLVEVRTFIHDPDEELGHDDSMVRDVGDLRQEGQTLKMHRDLDVPDDEDDTGLPDEMLMPWALPSRESIIPIYSV